MKIPKQKNNSISTIHYIIWVSLGRFHLQTDRLAWKMSAHLLKVPCYEHLLMDSPPGAIWSYEHCSMTL